MVIKLYWSKRKKNINILEIKNKERSNLINFTIRTNYTEDSIKYKHHWEKFLNEKILLDKRTNVLYNSKLVNEITFDKGNYELSFDWQAGGLQTDGLYVCWIPVRDSIKLNSVSMSSLLPEWVERYSIDFDRATPYLSQTTWNTVLDTIYTNGEAYNLVFVWNNSVLAYSSLGAAIDNLVILQEGRCSRPTDLKANPKGDDMVLSWQGSADAYDVRCRNNLTGEVVEYNNVTEKHQVISDLPEGMCTYFVRSKCDGIAGAWSTISKFLFYPGSHCIDFLALNKELKELPHGFGATIGYSMIEDDIKTIDDAINEAVLEIRANKEMNNKSK